MDSNAVSSTTPSGGERKKLPTAVITIGMAGSGKTTLMQRMVAHLSQHKIPRYVVNVSNVSLLHFLVLFVCLCLTRVVCVPLERSTLR